MRWTVVLSFKFAILPLTLMVAQATPAPQAEELIGRLGSENIEVREKATRELEKLGPLAWPALRQALAGRPSPEVRQRALRLLKKQKPVLPTAEELRAGRAIEVLEQIGTAAAREALESLARQAANTLLAADARAAVERLRRRPTTPRDRKGASR